MNQGDKIWGKENKNTNLVKQEYINPTQQGHAKLFSGKSCIDLSKRAARTYVMSTLKIHTFSKKLPICPERNLEYTKIDDIGYTKKIVLYKMRL